MAYSELTDLKKQISEEKIIDLTNDKGTGTDSTGETDGATGEITEMTNTSFFEVGGYVTVSAGFPTTGPYKILSKTTSSIVLDAISNSIQTGIIVSSAINEEISNGCRQQGEDLIDSYCGQVAEVPFVTVPGVIKAHSLTLWIYNLYTRRSVAPELVRKNYEDVIAHLKDIAAGKATLPPIGASEVATGNEVNIKSGDRIFTRDKMKGF